MIRFANRVPLIYQQSSCCTYKAVGETKWNNYGVSQSSGSTPRGPLVILIHMASVWVPFVSEGKEAIADYDEIRNEVRLAIAECGRRLGTLIRRKRTRVTYAKRRDVFTRYIDEVVAATRAIAVINKEQFRQSLVSLSKTFTAQADMEFDDHGKVIKKHAAGNDLGLQDTIVLDGEGDGDGNSEVSPEDTLFGPDPDAKPAKSGKTTPKKTKKRKSRKR